MGRAPGCPRKNENDLGRSSRGAEPGDNPRPDEFTPQPPNGKHESTKSTWNVIMF